MLSRYHLSKGDTNAALAVARALTDEGVLWMMTFAAESVERWVKAVGPEAARELLKRVFRPTDRQWRGIGNIAHSGWRLAPEYAKFDAELRFGVADLRAHESDLCRAGEVLQGLIRPDECPAFGTACTPSHPLGAPMVSGEGACSAYHQYRA